MWPYGELCFRGDPASEVNKLWASANATKRPAGYVGHEGIFDLHHMSQWSHDTSPPQTFLSLTPSHYCRGMSQLQTPCTTFVPGRGHTKEQGTQELWFAITDVCHSMIHFMIHKVHTSFYPEVSLLTHAFYCAVILIVLTAKCTYNEK